MMKRYPASEMLLSLVPRGREIVSRVEQEIPGAYAFVFVDHHQDASYTLASVSRLCSKK